MDAGELVILQQTTQWHSVLTGGCRLVTAWTSCAGVAKARVAACIANHSTLLASAAAHQPPHQAAQALMEETLLRRTRTVSLLEWWRFAYFR
jgi:hypothetical protein